MQNTKPTQTVKFVAFSVKYAAVVAPQNVKRPSASDPRRECWNRAAKLIWRCVIILTGILVMISLRTMHVEETATISIIADRAPELVQEVVEYIKRF
jgi:hypothetical protein